MKALIILSLILLVLILFNMLRVGVFVSYVTDEAARLSLILSKLHISILPKKKKKKKEKKPKEKKEKEPKKKKVERVPIKNRITFEDITDVLHAIGQAIHRFRSKIVIHRFKFWFVSSHEDPYKTVKTYNQVNNALCILGTWTDPNLVIRKSDIKTATDFIVGKNYLDFELKMTIRIGQILVIGFILITKLLKVLFRFLRRSRKMNKLSEVLDPGKGVQIP